MGEKNLDSHCRYGGNGDETEGMLARPPVSPQAGAPCALLSPLWGGLESPKKIFRPYYDRFPLWQPYSD